MTQQSPAPGWYPDPSGAPSQRYFDGQQWTDQHSARADPAQLAAKKSSGLAITALVMGIAAICLGLIPILGYIAFPLAAVGLVLGIISIARSRQSGRGMAITGSVLCVLGLVLGIVGQVIVQRAFSDLGGSLDEIAGNSTEAVLQNDLDVEIGQFVVSQAGYLESSQLPITLRNKGSEVASFTVQVEAVNAQGARIADDTAFVQNLSPGQSISKELFQFVPSAEYSDLNAATFRIVQVSKY